MSVELLTVRLPNYITAVIPGEEDSLVEVILETPHLSESIGTFNVFVPIKTVYLVNRRWQLEYVDRSDEQVEQYFYLKMNRQSIVPFITRLFDAERNFLISSISHRRFEDACAFMSFIRERLGATKSPLMNDTIETMIHFNMALSLLGEMQKKIV